MVTLTNGELAVLQGTGRLRRFARVSLWGTVGGLLISVPLFYWLRSDSIVPSIVAYAACGAHQCVGPFFYGIERHSMGRMFLKFFQFLASL